MGYPNADILSRFRGEKKKLNQACHKLPAVESGSASSTTVSSDAGGEPSFRPPKVVQKECWDEATMLIGRLDVASTDVPLTSDAERRESQRLEIVLDVFRRLRFGDGTVTASFDSNKVRERRSHNSVHKRERSVYERRCDRLRNETRSTKVAKLGSTDAPHDNLPNILPFVKTSKR